MNFIPTYRVVEIEKLNNKYRITFINLTNDFDVIRLKVPHYIGNLIFEGDDYSINTIIKRTWYTLWLGKRTEHYVLGNVDSKGEVLVTTISLTNKGKEDFIRDCNIKL